MLIRKEDIALARQKPFVLPSLKEALPENLVDDQVSLGKFDTRLPYTPISKSALTMGQVTFELAGNLELDPALNQLSKRLGESLRFNGTTQALVEIQNQSNGNVHLIFKSCKYSDYMATAVAGSKNEPQLELGDKTLLEYMNSKGYTIEDVLKIGSVSPLVKTLGVSALVISSDGYLFLSSSASWVHNSPGLLVPPASGSADIGSDYVSGEKRNIQEFIFREYEEEVDGEGDVRFKLIGFDSESNRLGKPEAFFLAFSNKTLKDLALTSSKDDALKIQENDSKIALAFKIFDGANIIFNDDLLDLIAMTRDPLKGEEIFKRKFSQTQEIFNPGWRNTHSTPELRQPFVSYPLQAALFHFLRGVQAECGSDNPSQLFSELSR